MTKVIIKKLLFFIYLFITVIILLEVLFRILPTASPVAIQPITNEEDTIRMYPNETITYSLGKNFYQVVKKTTNNYGFYSSLDYLKGSKPDLAIIGDSFVEALQIKNEDTMGEIISKLKPGLDVYQLGVSGVSLSQYLKMIKYANKEFYPKHFIVVIVGNDFDESLCDFRIKEGTWCYNSKYELSFTPFEGYSQKRKIARNSAFIRYAVYNAGLNWRRLMFTLGIKDPGMKTEAEYHGNTERFKSGIIEEASKKVINKFFNEIVSMGLANKITLILDSERQDIYSKKSTTSYFNNMRKYMIELSNLNEITIIDMEKVFREDYIKNNIKFDFPTDNHWNEYAHQLVAQTIIKNLN